MSAPMSANTVTCSGLLTIGYTGSIVSFEPVDTTFSMLAEHAAPDGSWRTVQMALGAEDGEATVKNGQLHGACTNGRPNPSYGV